MEIRVPEVPECYNVRNHVKTQEPLSKGVEAMFSLIQEFIKEAYSEGYITGHKDGAASNRYEEGGTRHAS